MSIHAVKREQTHQAWDKSIPPVLTVPSGSIVHVSCLDGSNGQLGPTSTATDVANLKIELCVQVNGPIYVQGAQPGDTLQIDLLDIKTADWGWTAIIPGFGLLADEFPEPAIKVWDLCETGTTTVSAAGDEAGVGAGDEVLRYAYLNEEKGIRIPIRPFAGEMGVARGAPGAWSTIPPYATGGNVDTKHLTKGSTLYLPIEVEGALFSIGDGHAAQGDGGEWAIYACPTLLNRTTSWDRSEEVCGTAIETPMEVTVRLTVRKDKPYTKTPHFRTITPQANTEEYYCTTGVDADIKEATRSAVRNMITYLVAEHGLDRVEAYILCSVAGDLKMHEVVDMPNYVIGMMIPKSVLGNL